MAVRLAVSRRTFRVSANGFLLARPFLLEVLRIAMLACDSAAAVPEVAITSETRSAPKRRSALRSSRAINCFIRASSSSEGGSPGRNSLVKRTAPSGRLTVSLMRLRSESVISQLPPPTSISRHLPCVPGSPITPRWMRRASSRPEMISTSQPVSDLTQARKAWALRASRRAEVATARTPSALCILTAR